LKLRFDLKTVGLEAFDLEAVGLEASSLGAFNRAFIAGNQDYIGYESSIYLDCRASI